MKKIFFLVFLVLLLSMPASAVLQKGSLKVFAITENGKAISADLALSIEQGEGKIYTSIKPLVGTSTQTTEIIAVNLSKKYFPNADKYNYWFDIESDASLVEGPSAGAAMALLVISMLEDKPLPKEIGLTGTITEDGYVGNVGGVYEKSEEAARIGTKLFMVPIGEKQQIIKTDSGIESINLSTFALENWGMKVVEVSDIDEVLDYAFTDIENIDVNKVIQEIPEFVPQATIVPERLGRMKTLTENLVASTGEEVALAKKSLASALIQKPRVVSTLLSALNTAESDIALAKLLLDQNYLFSAANFAFLAKVNAGFVRDVSEQQEIIEENSTVFGLKLLELKNRMAALRTDLNSFMPVEELEWHIAAQQRLSWAEFKLQQIEGAAPVVIEQEAPASEIALAKVHSFEFAVAWMNVAEQFFEISQSSKTKAVMEDFFDAEAQSLLSKAEKGLSLVEQESSDQAREKIEAARIKIQRNWNEAAAFDAVFALSLSDAAVFNRQENPPETKKRLEEGIRALDQQIAAKNNSMVWAQLYLDHARYFFKATEYYESQNSRAQAEDSAKKGIALLFLAENLFSLTNQLKNHYDSLPAEKILAENVEQIQKQVQIESIPQAYFAIILFLVAMLLFSVMIIIVFAWHSRKYSIVSLGKETDYLLSKRRGLQKQAEQKNISQKEFEDKTIEIDSRLSQLAQKKEVASSSLIKMDLMETQVLSERLAIRKMSKQYANGLIMKEHFEVKKQELLKKIGELQEEIKKHEAIVKAGQAAGESKWEEGSLQEGKPEKKNFREKFFPKQKQKTTKKFTQKTESEKPKRLFRKKKAKQS